jgi:hypothetical protein
MNSEMTSSPRQTRGIPIRAERKRLFRYGNNMNKGETKR